MLRFPGCPSFRRPHVVRLDRKGLEREQAIVGRFDSVLGCQTMQVVVLRERELVRPRPVMHPPRLGAQACCNRPVSSELIKERFGREVVRFHKAAAYPTILDLQALKLSESIFAAKGSIKAHA